MFGHPINSGIRMGAGNSARTKMSICLGKLKIKHGRIIDFLPLPLDLVLTEISALVPYFLTFWCLEGAQ